MGARRGAKRSALAVLLLLIQIQVLLAEYVTIAGQSTLTDDDVVASQELQYANIGDPAQFLCKVPEVVEICVFRLNNLNDYRIVPGRTDRGMSYFGQGLAQGQCGAQFEKVTESLNGNVTCVFWVYNGGTEPLKKLMQLVVTVAPEKPILEVRVGNQNGNSVYKERDVLTAICTVKGGRPPPNITWLLDDDIIKKGVKLGDESCLLSPYDVCDVQQSLTRTLVPSDNNKKLRCIVDHPSFKGSQNIAEHQIYVNYPPKKIEQPIERFGLVEGMQGRVPVVIEANPKPTINWKVGSEYISEGENKGRYTVEPTTNMSPGHYETALLINALTKDDTNYQYTITAKNEIGSETYAVTISTSPEPKVLEIGAGMIIIIVVLVIIIILILAAVVIARAKGKFCFAVGNAEKRIAPPSEGTENPAVNHHASSEYINNSPELKKEKPKEDTPV